MKRTRPSLLSALALGAGVITWVVLDLLLRHRGWVPGLTGWAAVVGLTVSVVVLVAGLAVRRLRSHQSTWMTPTGAAATAAAAQASAIVGAVMSGAYAGQFVLALLDQRHGATPAMTDLAWTAGGCLLAGLVWTGVGVLVEHWCAIDASDDEDSHRGGSDGHGAQAGAAARTCQTPQR